MRGNPTWQSIMSNVQFLDRAIATVKGAVDLDHAGEHEKAYQQYYNALELFMLVLKYEANPQRKQMIQAKAKEYMDRAEILKKHMEGAGRIQREGSAVNSNESAVGGIRKA